MRVTTDPDELDNLMSARRRMVRRRLSWVTVRSLAQGLALGTCGYLFGWGLQHEVMVMMLAAVAGVCVLVSFYVTWYLMD